MHQGSRATLEQGGASKKAKGGGPDGEIVDGDVRIDVEAGAGR